MAKVNNNMAHKLLKDEFVSKRKAVAAMKVLENEEKVTGKIRSDEHKNFPPLPKEVTDEFAQV